MSKKFCLVKTDTKEVSRLYAEGKATLAELDAAWAAERVWQKGKLLEMLNASAMEIKI